MGTLNNKVFAVEYRNVPGKGVFARGGLKFRSDEAALRQQYRAVLEKVSLETLLGEAALWVLGPSTAAIWAFPPLLWRLPVDRAVIYSGALFLLLQVAQMLFFSRRLNYVLLVLGNRALQVIVYAASALAEWRMGAPWKAVALAVWLALMATGVVQVLFTVPFTPILKRLFELGPADQALRNVAQRHARRLGIDAALLRAPRES
ncbi:MAG: hypothetical protein HY236_01955 [Acidobacteria bacterium]|nr:hypothetical protein [Acidobacteriota bacterium]